MENILIVKPTLEDTIGTIEVQYMAWLATYPNQKLGITLDDIEDRYKDAFTGKKLDKRKKLISNPEPNENFIIAKDNNKVVGICLWVRGDDRNQLQSIYILPEYQGRGIGKMLWNSMRSFFDPNKDTYVVLADYNTGAMNFYSKLGFVDTGRRFEDEYFRMKSGSIMPDMEMVKKAND